MILCVFDSATRTCPTCGYVAGRLPISRVCRPPLPRRQGAYPPPQQERGPGTELKKLLRDWLGIEASPTCSCNAMARRMNAEGVAWCLSAPGMADILSVMRAEHAKQWADGRTKLPWTDLGARTLVRLACRRAEAKASA